MKLFTDGLTFQFRIKRKKRYRSWKIAQNYDVGSFMQYVGCLKGRGGVCLRLPNERSYERRGLSYVSLLQKNNNNIFEKRNNLYRLFWLFPLFSEKSRVEGQIHNEERRESRSSRKTIKYRGAQVLRDYGVGSLPHTRDAKSSQPAILKTHTSHKFQTFFF